MYGLVAGFLHVERVLGERRHGGTALANDLPRVAVGVGALGLVAGLASDQGGYFPTSWSWASLAMLWIAAIALLVRKDVRISVLETATLASFAGLLGWIVLSAVWSIEPSQSVVEAQRVLVYAAALLALLLVADRASVGALLAGVIAGITVVCAYALATRLFPERLGIFDPSAGYRLSEPVGYWNGLGIFAAVGAVLAACFAAGSGSRVWRALAAASLVIVLPTLYFTFSRGAWLALAAGIAAAIALESRRLRLITMLLVLAPAPALVVWLASRPAALRRDNAALAEASHAGHRVALIVVALGVAAAATPIVLAAVEQRVRIGRAVRVAYAASLLLALCVALAVVFARLGGPDTIARKAYDVFNAPPPALSSNLNSHLSSFSGSWRSNMWRAAWHDYQANPWLGSGAGTYERYWNRHRDISYTVRDAHSLYLETLAELGPLGLALLVAALGIPLLAAVRARRLAVVPAAFGAYVAYLLHAAGDWDWELTAVTVSAVLVAGTLLLAAREEGFRATGWRLRRLTLLLAVVPLTGFVIVAFVGNSAADSSTRALLSARYAAAEADARTAIRWTPWSPDSWFLLGQAQLERGERSAARASFQRAIGKDHGNWEFWYSLALASDGAARRRALDHALRLNPIEPVLVTARSLGLENVDPLAVARRARRR